MVRRYGGSLKVLAPLSIAIAGMAALAVPAAAQAGGPSQPSARSGGVPSFPSAAAMIKAAGPAAAAAVAAPQPGAAPAAAAITSTNAALWYTGTNQAVYVAGLAPVTGAASLGGRLVGGPAAVAILSTSLGGPAIGLFGRGTDNALWELTSTSTGSLQWISLGGRLTSSPGAAAGALTGGDKIDVVARGGDGAVWIFPFTATTAGPWARVGGGVLAGTAPTAVNVGGTLYVLVVGGDGALWRNSSTNGTTWSGWTSLHGRVSGPGSATPAAGVGVAFARGTDNTTWSNEFAGTTTGVSPGWHPLGGIITSGVGAASAPDATTWVLALGRNGHIWGRTGVWPTLGPWTQIL
jgi:hypothetical protein